MGMLRFDDMFLIQLQGTDKSGFHFREEMQGAAQKGHMAPDRLSAGKSADGLVDHGLEDGRRQILLCGSVVNQGLDVGFGEHAASGGNGVKGTVILRIFV